MSTETGFAWWLKPAAKYIGFYKLTRKIASYAYLTTIKVDP